MEAFPCGQAHPHKGLSGTGTAKSSPHTQGVGLLTKAGTASNLPAMPLTDQPHTAQPEGPQLRVATPWLPA